MRLLTVSFRFPPVSQIKVANCMVMPGQKPQKVTGSKLQFTMTTELYIKASPDELCILIVVPVAKIQAFGFVPAIDVGSAIGGYCRLPNDRCVPDGFFLNMNLAPQIPNLPAGILADILGFDSDSSSTSAEARGSSLGFFLDKKTGTPTGGLIRAFIQGPKFLGLSLAPSLSLEFQYIAGEGECRFLGDFEQRGGPINFEN